MNFLKLLTASIFIFLVLPIQIVCASEKLVFHYITEDLEEDHWAYNEIIDFIYADIIEGSLDDDFYMFVKPNKKITRAEFVKMIVTTLDIEVTSNQELSFFSDVKMDNWYYSYVNTASSLGIITGKTNNKFNPNDFITRAEIATIITRAFDKRIEFQEDISKKFKDVDHSHWAYKEISKASATGIVQGNSFNLFMPNENATRAQGIVMLHRALNMESFDLPNEKDLMAMLEDHIKQTNVYLKNKSFDKLYNLYDANSTGYYNYQNKFSGKLLENFWKDGDEIIIETDIEDITINTLSVNTRRAVIEVSNIYLKYGVDLLIDEMDGVTYYLKKDKGSENWKIYNFTPSYIE